MSEVIEVDGVEVHVEGSGHATVMLVHGWPDTHRLWDAQVQVLKQRFRCVRFTLPGFDIARPPRPMDLGAMTAFLRAVADATSPERPVTLLLHDWGCIFGYEFAARHPERVARVIGLDIGDVNSGAYLRSLTAPQKLGIAGYQLWLAAAGKIGGAAGDRMSRWMARKLRCRTDPAAIGAQMNYPYALQWSGGLKGLARFQPHVPMLYIYGRRKLFMFHSPQWLETVAATPGGASQAWDSGHWVMRHDVDGFNAVLMRWLTAQRADQLG